MPQNYVLPANAILIHGVPLNEEFEAAPGSAILPGDIVCFGTNYCDGGNPRIKECPANHEKFLGVAEQSHEGDRDDVFTAGDQVRVLDGDIIFAARLAANITIICGDLLKTAASGEVTKFNCELVTSDPGNNNACLLVAQSRESKASATTYQWLIAKFLR